MSKASRVLQKIEEFVGGEYLIFRVDREKMPAALRRGNWKDMTEVEQYLTFLKKLRLRRGWSEFELEQELDIDPGSIDDIQEISSDEYRVMSLGKPYLIIVKKNSKFGDGFESLTRAQDLVARLNEAEYELMTWDHKQDPIDLFKDILTNLGMSVYDVPSLQGSDTNGLIVSKKKLTSKKIKQIEVEGGLRFDEGFESHLQTKMRELDFLDSDWELDSDGDESYLVVDEYGPTEYQGLIAKLKPEFSPQYSNKFKGLIFNPVKKLSRK